MGFDFPPVRRRVSWRFTAYERSGAHLRFLAKGFTPITKAAKWVLLGFLLTAFCATKVRAATHTAATCNALDIQAAINSSAQGDTVVVPSGTCTWTTQVTNLVSGIPLGITIQGATTCAGTGSALACTDNTNITLAYASGPALYLYAPSSSSYAIRVTGLTLIWTGVYPNTGQLVVNGTAWPPTVNFRIDHNHVELNTTAGGRFSQLLGVYGLIDHNRVDVASGCGAGVFNPGVDMNTGGFLSWQLPTGLGTNQAVFYEDNYFTYQTVDSEGPFDSFVGARVVFRHNTVLNGSDWGGHGTDSGQHRSTMFTEDYLNSYTNSLSGQPVVGQQRGGTFLWWGNTYTGLYKAANLLCYRCGYQVTGVGQWGTANGTRWVLGSTSFTATASRQNNSAGPDWTANTTYSQSAAIYPLTNNAAYYNYTTQAACTSGATYPAFSQTIGTLTADGSCNWVNSGGGPAGTGAHWCAINRDIPATSDAPCSAITPGDTASTFFDGSGPGGYPARDQVGRGHNQVLQPDYEWLNTPDYGVTANPAAYIQANRDYYLFTTSFSGASGVGAGPSGSIPPTCTPYVAYWATDQSVLYQCAAPSSWIAYYAPYTYPHPLTKLGGVVPNPPTSLSVTSVQ